MENQTDKESISKRDIILMNRSDYFWKRPCGRIFLWLSRSYQRFSWEYVSSLQE